MFTSLIQPIRRTFDFRGRARRTEYWSFILWQLGFLAATLNLVSLLSESTLRETLIAAIFGLYFIAFGLPTLALQVRRVHDHNTSGWALFIMFLPYVGVGWTLWMMLASGSAGPNRYGEDPRKIAFDAALFD